MLLNNNLLNQKTPQPALVVGSPITLNGQDWGFGDRTPGEYADQFSTNFYDSKGRSIMSFAMPWTTDYGTFGKIAVLDRHGLYPASIEVDKRMGDDPTERHLYPSIQENASGEYLILHEEAHLGNISVYKGNSDLTKFTPVLSLSDAAARMHLYKTASGFALIYQYNSTDIAVRTCDESGTTWSSRAIIATNGGISGVRNYASAVYGSDNAIGGWYYFVIQPRWDTGAYSRVEFILKTQDFVTFYNYTETHSFNAGSPLGPNSFATNGYTLYGNVSGTDEIEIAPVFMDSFANIYRVGYWTDNPNKFVTTRWNGSAWSTVASTSNHNITFAHPTFLQPSVRWGMKRKNDLYIIGTIDNGTVGKPHLLHSPDDGVNWNDLGDLIPGINDTTGYYRATGPMNYLDIPNNKNFAIWISEPAFDNTTGKFADMYLVEAAFGSIQPYESIEAPGTITALSDVAGARYIYETDLMSSGQFVDKSLNGRGMTTTGSPTLSGDELIFDGVDDSFILDNFSDFTGDTEFTIVVVGRWKGGSSPTDKWFGGSGGTGNNNNWISYGVTYEAGPKVRYQIGADSNVLNRYIAHGIEDTTTDGDFHIYTFKSDGYHYRLYVDGVEVNKVMYANRTTTGNLTHNGKWLGHAGASVGSIRIGAVPRSSIIWSNTGQKANAYWPTCLSREDQRSIEYFLANKYSITLQE